MSEKDILKKMRRKGRKKLKEEKRLLLEEQERLRDETIEAESEMMTAQQTLIDALSADDKSSVPCLKASVDAKRERLKDLREQVKLNGELIALYSKALRDDREGRAQTITSTTGLITGLGGFVLGLLGLGAAYSADENGSLINKHSLDWVKNLPIFKKRI